MILWGWQRVIQALLRLAPFILRVTGHHGTEWILTSIHVDEHVKETFWSWLRLKNKLWRKPNVRSWEGWALVLVFLFLTETVLSGAQLPIRAAVWRAGYTPPWRGHSCSPHRWSFSGSMLDFIRATRRIPAWTPFPSRVAKTQHEFRSFMTIL